MAKLTQQTKERNKPIAGYDNDGDSEEEEECDGSDTEDNQISTLDPVTNQTMIDPVKNTICGHSYERSTIARLMQKKPDMVCPAIGCVIPLKNAELVDDVSLKKYIANRK